MGLEKITTDNIIIRPIGEESIIDQVTLFNKVFELKWTVEEWRYYNYQNPLSKGGTIIGAFDGDRLIGITCFMAMKFILDSNVYYALHPCNAAVDPDYRGNGIFTKIIKLAEDYYKNDYDFMIAYCPNNQSYPAFMKMGWSHILDNNLLYLKIDTNTIIKRLFMIPLPEVLNIFSMYFKVKSKIFIPKNIHLTLNKSNGIPPIDSNIANSFSKNIISFANEQKTFEWKLSHQSYVYYTVTDNNTPIAFFIVREYGNGAWNGPIANIVYTCYSSENLNLQKVAYSLLVNDLRKKFVTVSIKSSLNYKPEKKILKSCGYLNILKKSPYLIKIITNDVNKIAVLSNKSIWNPQRIESDTIIQF